MDPDLDTIAFAEKVLALLRQGAFTATYKYAVLIGLIDLSLEGYTGAGMPPESVTTARRSFVHCWPSAEAGHPSCLTRRDP